jgi:geranylgeranyl diphosphate synthase type I
MFSPYLEKINGALRDFLCKADRRYCLDSNSQGLFRYSQEFILRQGKRIRPLLFTLSYKGYARKNVSPDKNLYTCAAALELLHDFFLIHDDVIDNSGVRRGKPTLHKLLDQKVRIDNKNKIGSRLAIVAADILFALAIEAFLSIQEDKDRKETALKKLLEAAASTCSGEILDVIFSQKNIEKVSLDEILSVYRLKTAKYTFEGPLVTGAILAGVPNEEIIKLSSLAMAAGEAFQIHDDMLDLFSTQKTIGKPILADLTESKKTLLIFKAHDNLKNRDKKQFTRILTKEKKTLKDLKKIRRLIVQSGSYKACYGTLKLLQNFSQSVCRSLKMEPPQKKMLETLISQLSPLKNPIKI